MTFTLDAATADRLRRMAALTRRPQSAIVRDAIRDFEANSQRLSPAEQQRMLAVIDEIAARPIDRSAADVRKELAELRAVERE